MIEEIGIVKSVDGSLARVMVQKKSSCDGCTAGACRPGDQSMEIEAINSIGAREGQRVRISVQTLPYLKGSAIVYGIPAVFLVLGAVLGKEVMPGFIAGIDPDLLSAAFGFAAFAVSFLIVKVWSGSLSASASRPVIEEVMQE